MTNIAEILRYAPQGLKLYSLVDGEVTFKEVDTTQEYYPIYTTDKQNDISDAFTKDGKIYYDYKDAECVLFPSKEHKSWDEWQKVLFKVGDIVTNIKNIEQEQKTFIISSRSLNFIGTTNSKHELFLQGEPSSYRYATPEEREQFFNELNKNGYKWNADTKQIEKIKQQYTPKYDCSGYEGTINREEQFTIDDFKPFDKVLTRNNPDGTWSANYYSHKVKSGYVCVAGFTHSYCIPYNDETSKLLGTKNGCPKKYKTW